MDILLYAQPYDISAEGFYFRDKEEYDKKVKEAKIGRSATSWLSPKRTSFRARRRS